MSLHSIIWLKSGENLDLNSSLKKSKYSAPRPPTALRVTVVTGEEFSPCGITIDHAWAELRALQAGVPNTFTVLCYFQYGVAYSISESFV